MVTNFVIGTLNKKKEKENILNVICIVEKASFLWHDGGKRTFF